MKLLLLFIAFFDAAPVKAQLPKDGTYTYTIRFAEWQGATMGATCSVIIKGKHIKVLNDGKGNLSGVKGSVIAEGTILKHRKTGQWIIAQKKEDAYASEVGGCSDGPVVIEFHKKVVWLC